MTDDNREGDEELGPGESGAPLIERGAAIVGDEDAVAAAANTSLDMDGFETGAGFGLEDSPDELGGDVEVEALQIRSSADEVDLDEAVIASPTGVGGADPVVDIESLIVEELPELPSVEELPELPILEGIPPLPTAEAPPAPPPGWTDGPPGSKYAALPARDKCLP